MAFDTLDLGRILQTSEAIKGMRRQGQMDKLQEQYLGGQIARGEQAGQFAANNENRAAAQEARQATQFSQEQQINNTKLLNAAAAEIAQNPAAAERWAPQLQQSGVLDPSFDWRSMKPEQLQQAALQIYQSTSTALQALQGPQKPQEEPEAIRTLRALQSDPKLMEADIARRRASAQQVNVNTKEQSEEAKIVGKGFGEQFIELQKGGMDATNKMNRYDRLEKLLDGVSTGKLTPAITQVSAAAEALGINIDKNLGPKQAAQALAAEIALSLRNPSGGAGMPGAMSDKDREFLVSMTPNLSQTPQGNQLIIETAKKLARRDQEVAKIAREYRQKNGSLNEGFYDELAAFSARNPLFGEPLKQQGGPQPGVVEDGYRFKGGNPADPNSWERAQ